MTDDNSASTTLGTIGETEVTLSAEGPRAQWAVDVLQHKFAQTFAAIKNQVEYEQ